MMTLMNQLTSMNGRKTNSNQLPNPYYLFITYIVTSKPKRISVAAGFVHIIFSLVKSHILFSVYVNIIARITRKVNKDNHEFKR